MDENEVLVKNDNDTLKIKEHLSAEQLQKAEKYAGKLADNHQNTIINYGNEVQNELSEFTDQVVGRVKNKNIGEIGDTLRSLVTSLDSADPEGLSNDKKPRIFRLFKKVKDSVFEMTAKYQEVSSQISKIAQRLESQQQELLKDNDMLDEMYQMNQMYFQKLNVLIVGGKLRQEQLVKEMAALKQKIESNQADQFAMQQFQDMQNQAQRLDHKIADLLLTREISLQQAPQIRMIQNNNSILSEKIQSSITTAIPLWKNQVAIALSLLNQKDAINVQNAVANTTNELLKKNSEMLSQSTIEITKAAQKGIVDVDTLRETQQNLITTVKEVLKIQSEGAQQRQKIETELSQMEVNLKNNLMIEDGSK